MNRDYYLMRYPSLVKQADEGQAIEEHLGPLQHAYVADAVGADAMQRGLRQAGQTLVAWIWRWMHDGMVQYWC